MKISAFGPEEGGFPEPDQMLGALLQIPDSDLGLQQPRKGLPGLSWKPRPPAAPRQQAGASRPAGAPGASASP